MKFEIKFYEAFPKLCLYAVHIKGKEDCEVDIFLKKFIDNQAFRQDVQEIKAILVKMGKFGAHEQRFRPEDNIHALPKTHNNLRLYCIRCTSNTVILCGGGHKTSQRVQDSPDCYPHFKFGKIVEKFFRDRVSTEDIRYNGCFLDGDLAFDTELI
ncbi:hypothetical protein [Spirosoma luteum]|uniref:hypothetical protein n=1 Tax=Spirosoma luteum TaxID=431553 RepID=UPI00036ED366|nr:hypothetical protein [Spirosoma luteum]